MLDSWYISSDKSYQESFSESMTDAVQSTQTFQLIDKNEHNLAIVFLIW